MAQQERIELVDTAIKQLLEKEGLRFSYEVTFPVYNILPDDVKLALNILMKHGMSISTILVKKQTSSPK